jgi:hypothetical protein
MPGSNVSWPRQVGHSSNFDPNVVVFSAAVPRDLFPLQPTAANSAASWL